MKVSHSSQTALVGGFLALATRATGAYVVQDAFTPANFFNEFTFFSEKDPTNGMVDFANREKAISNTLIATAPQANNAIYLGVDSKTKVAKRPSVRLHSKKAYDKGLFVADIQHMPTGCGVWPAFWLLGSGAEWPINGEIDILEGVNNQANNSITLHTSAGCKVDNTGFTGKLNTANCDVNDPSQDKNAGCAISNPAPESYGEPFNKAGGGVLVTEVTSQAISAWFFTRSAVPADISKGNPDPSKWGKPVARFAGQCNIDQHFKKMQMIFDTTFCGDWAGQTWSKGSCAAKAPTCEEYVQNNPAAFDEAYFLVNSVKVYAQQKPTSRVMRRGGFRIPSFGTGSVGAAPIPTAHSHKHWWELFRRSHDEEAADEGVADSGLRMPNTWGNIVNGLADTLEENRRERGHFWKFW